MTKQARFTQDTFPQIFRIGYAIQWPDRVVCIEGDREKVWYRLPKTKNDLSGNSYATDDCKEFALTVKSIRIINNSYYMTVLVHWPLSKQTTRILKKLRGDHGLGSSDLKALVKTFDDLILKDTDNYQKVPVLHRPYEDFEILEW